MGGEIKAVREKLDDISEERSKTTLAKFVFNDENVEREFELKFWVCVSENFDLRTIVKNILDTTKETQLNSLKDELQQKIRGQKYLLVLDDIWNRDINKWIELKDLLMVGARGSKIIVTTRENEIANKMTTLTYELKGLSNDESWELFTKKAFGSRLAFESHEHEMIGRDILRKCKGVPLLIQTIGATLFSKKTQLEWSRFRDRELSQVTNDVMPILRLSYNHLPPHLKHCFALCSLYPEDHEIHIKELVNLWMAQGYVIHKDSTQCTEDVGYEYFDDLLRRSFFQEIEVDKWGDPSTCKMHDLMHELAKSVSREGQHLFIPYGDDAQDSVLSSTSFEKNKVRTILGGSRFSFSYKEKGVEFISNSRHLRALEVTSNNFTSDLDISDLVRILKLRHLRYFILSDRSIKTLPNSIARLQNLQILNLNGCNGLQKFPKGITKLVNLMELYLEGCDSLTHMPCGIGKLPVLQVLSKFVVSHQKGSAKLIELDGLNKLKGNLEIKGLEEVKDPESEFRVANLKAKQYLKHLELKWLEDWRSEDKEIRIQKEKRYLEELKPHVNLKSLSITGYGGITFPDWISTLTNLVKLTIQDCTKCRIIPQLDQLLSLKELSIESMPELEWIEVSCDSSYLGGEALFFPCLEDIKFWRCPKLVGWRRRSTTLNQDYIFSRLLSLRMYDCENLRDWIASFPSLKNLSLFRCNVKLMELMLKLTISSSMVSCELVELEIKDIKDFQVLQEDLLRHCTSLKTLWISACNKLRSVSQALKHLTSLTYLQIWYCDELDISDLDGHGLKNLIFFKIGGIPKLGALPEGLHHASKLLTLIIKECKNLKCLPSWMSSLTSLDSLEIKDCSSEMYERCKNNTATDWPFISHVPSIYIDKEWIKIVGIYI